MPAKVGIHNQSSSRRGTRLSCGVGRSLLRCRPAGSMKETRERSEQSRSWEQVRRETERRTPPALDPLLRFRVASDRTGRPPRHGQSVGELSRSVALAIAEDRLGESRPATLSPGHLALIEAMYRMVYVLATLNGERLLDARREKDLDGIVAAAHEVTAETMNEGPA